MDKLINKIFEEIYIGELNRSIESILKANRVENIINSKVGDYMDNWFTVEKVDNNTYAISEYKHWEQTHCYLLLGTEYGFLIDTGLGVGNIKDVVCRITNKPIRVITTHVHWDHIGGHKYFDHISVHEADLKWITGDFPLSIDMVKSNLLKEPCTFPNTFTIESYELYQGNPTSLIQDQQLIDIGGRQIRAIHTPGHSPGHLCFFEEASGYLFSGDLIYLGTLDAYYPSTNPIKYMESIKKVKQLSINKILPGHYSLSIPLDIIDRIDKSFTELYENNQLVQGNGIFSYPDFCIHI